MFNNARRRRQPAALDQWGRSPAEVRLGDHPLSASGRARAVLLEPASGGLDALRGGGRCTKQTRKRSIDELTERLRSADSLLVADYRGLTNSQLASLRVELLKHGAKLSVVKNTLTRRAAEAAGADALLAMLEGPTAIAFVEADGDPVGGGEGAQRRGEGHEDPRAARWRALGQPDHGRRDREAREAAAARRPAGSARRGDRRPADAARRGAERAVAEPGRPDRRQDRPARGRWRHVRERRVREPRPRRQLRQPRPPRHRSTRR